MVNRCKNCGGLLYYDITAGQLKCESCDSYFDPEKYEGETGVKESGDTYEMNVYTCPNCGGTISSNELEAVEYCLYCGSFVTMDAQNERVSKPDYIIPFSKTKDDCKKSYSSMIRKKLYAPKEFRKDEFLEGFKGIFIPYWTYNYKFGPNVELTGVKETRHGDYIHKQHYDIKCHIDGNLDGVCYDASSSFDDEISGRIVPFDNKKLKPFKSPYMFGFFADTADIDSDVYEEDADEIARDEAWEVVTAEPDVAEGSPTRPSENKFDEKFNLRGEKYLAMLPVWFLTWRNKNRVAYSVVNGDTGEIYSEVPVDIKRYLLFSLLLAVPIFFLLNSFITFNASDMLTISSLLSFGMIILYSLQLEKVVRRCFHADDKGYITSHRGSEEAAEAVKKNILLSIISGVADLFSGIGVWAVIFILVVISLAFEYFLIGAVIFIVFAVVYTFYRVAKNGLLLKDITVLLDILGSLISLVISVLMLMADPAGDEFYYIAAILCIAGVGLTAILTMRRYNDLVTRPVPHFFDREAGGEV